MIDLQKLPSERSWDALPQSIQPDPFMQTCLEVVGARYWVSSLTAEKFLVTSAGVLADGRIAIIQSTSAPDSLAEQSGFRVFLLSEPDPRNPQSMVQLEPCVKDDSQMRIEPVPVDPAWTARAELIATKVEVAQQHHLQKQLVELPPLNSILGISAVLGPKPPGLEGGREL